MATTLEAICLLVGLVAILYGMITLYFWPLIRNGGMPQPKGVRLKSYGRIFEFLAYALNPKRWDNRIHRAFCWGSKKEIVYSFVCPKNTCGFVEVKAAVGTLVMYPGDSIEIIRYKDGEMNEHITFVSFDLDFEQNSDPDNDHIPEAVPPR